MRAARFHGVDKPVAIDEVEVPEPGSGEIQIRVRACGICGSDVHIVQGVTLTGPLPITLGHEAAGIVAALGPGVTTVAVGARVALTAGYGCGHCGYCQAGLENICPSLTIPGITRDGAQAEYVVVPERCAIPLPANVDFATGAILTDAVATPYRAIKRSGIGSAQTAAVFGLGGLGLHAVSILHQVVGATVVGIDPSPVARERALRFGASDTVDPTVAAAARQVRAVTGGVDASFEFVGAGDVVDQALKSLRAGGTCTVVGVGRDRLALGLRQETLVAGELRLQGSFGSTAADVVELVSLVATGGLDLRDTVTHRFALAETPEALRVLAEKDGDPIRVVVEQDPGV